ncbi:hypothetical protein [Aeromonas salmonicida]|uniref:hypothetical protein n=1 Tax=Aeromonas salmonicida TaxID=645 RepID=UPI0022404D5A|nr:hypothetical protein [Aeromonas salmonicida]
MGHRAVALLMAAQHDGKKRQEERKAVSVSICLGHNQQPATSNQQPATSNQQPATSNQQPATSNIFRTEDQQKPDAKRPLIERPFLIWSV